MTARHLLVAAVLICLTGLGFMPEVPASGAEAASLTDHVLYGVSGTNHELLRYQFDAGQLASKGVIRLSTGEALTGIEAMAYIPRHLNVYAFWQDPGDGNSKLVYVNSLTAEATVVGASLGTGSVTGATTVRMALNGQGDLVLPGSVDAVAEAAAPVLGADEATAFGDVRRMAVLATQTFGAGDPAATATAVLTGAANINPNNSPQAQFSLTKADGVVITRSDLHQNSPVDGNGVFFSGAATRVFLMPKGNGNQNTVQVNGQVYLLANGSTYEFTGAAMDVTVYNDNIHCNGKAMGKWWVGFNGAEVDFPAAARLLRVDGRTGAAVEVMTLVSEYDGLSASSSGSLYGTSGQSIFQLDPIAGTETLVGTMTGPQMMGLEYAGATLCGFSVLDGRLVPMSVAGTVLGASFDLGTTNLRSIIFMRNPDAPDSDGVSCD